jgi:signal transduction histidine kinase
VDTHPLKTDGPPKILCVDDELGILRVMKRGLEDDFQVFTAKNGKEGLSVLESHHDVAVIITDLKMEGMNGIEFLTEARNIAPDAMRIMVTAYSNMDVMMDAINKGYIYQFLPKPFEMEALVVSVKRAAEHYNHKKAYESTYKEWQKTQEKLVRADKLSMLGQLLSSVAHELGNPIANIHQATVLAQHEWTGLKDIYERLLHIQTSADVVALQSEMDRRNTAFSVTEFDNILRTLQNAAALITDIIQDLRGFSRLDDAEWIDVDVHLQIDRAINLLRTKYKYVIRFHKEFGPCALIRGLPGPLTQVFLNLLYNAAQSIESEGDVWIKTWKENGSLRISIKDNGRGISEEHLPRIFESGFTTKDETEGTGLGLTISNGIIQKHGGSIDVWSIVGQGTEFIITLPCKTPASKNL